MSTFKKCQVVMLPTNKKAVLRIVNENNIYTYNRIDNSILRHHLYFTSDDEIKEGDYAIYNNGYNSPGFVVKAVKVPNCMVYRRPNETWKDYGCKDGGITPLNKDVKKIIATTNSSLWEYDDTVPYPKTRPALPQPSQSFIEKYVEEYNKGNIITEVLVGYENIFSGTAFNIKGKIPTEQERLRACYDDGEQIMGDYEDLYKEKLKINPKDNTITIKKVKDSWTKDEVEYLCRKAFGGGVKATMETTQLGQMQKNEDKWIEENL